jgi:predicted dehydrogenase
MARKLKTAVIGLGSISQRGVLPHLDMKDARESVEMTALMDTVPGRAEALAKQYGVPGAYTDFEQVLKDPNVEAVVLATPIPAHFPHAKAALEAGKHVYAQKTMTQTKAEADELIALAAKKSLVLSASPCQIFSPSLQRIKGLIGEGAIGNLYWGFNPTMWEGHTTEDWRGQAGQALTQVAPTWYYKKGGGPVMDVAVYALHNLTSVLGPVSAVSAMATIAVPEREWKGEKIKVETEDNVLISLHFGGNVLGLTSGQLCQWGKTMWGQLCFFGARGAIEVIGSKEGTSWPEKFLLNNEEYDLKGWTPPIDDGLRLISSDKHSSHEEAHVYVDIAHFAECVKNGKKPVASAEQARHVIEVIELAYKSAATKQTLPTTTSFTIPGLP